MKKVPPALKVLAPLLICIIAWRSAAGQIRYEPIRFDAAQNLIMAANLYNAGVLSLSSSDPAAAPTAYRMPVYPVLLSLGMRVVFDRGELSPADIRSGRISRLQAGLDLLKYVNVAVFVLLAAATFAAGWLLSGSCAVALAAGLCVALSTSLLETVNCFLTENLTALLLVLVSLGLALLPGSRRGGAGFFTLGLLLAGLMLNNPVFFYFFPLATLLLWWGFRRRAVQNRAALLRTGVFILGFVLLTGFWMGRNYAHFGRVFLSERGGSVLHGRALLNMMTMREYLASFLFWTPNDTARRLLQKNFRPADYRNLDRDSEDGYRARTISRQAELRRQAGSTVQADRQLLSEAKTLIRKHFFRHLLATVPFAYRGIFVAQRLRLWDDVYLLKGTLVCYLLFFSLFALTLRSLASGEHALLAFLAPSLFLYAFFSFFTHNIPRYNIPLLPVLWIATALVVRLYGVRGVAALAGLLRRRGAAGGSGGRVPVEP